MQAVHNNIHQHGVNKYSSASDEPSPINEMIIGGRPWQAAHFLKPLLSELADETKHRWLTLVLSDEDGPETVKWLKSSGINNKRVQVLNHSANMDSLELTRKALASGTSHTVVSWVKKLDKPMLKQLELAARDGQCQGLAISSRLQA